jgi:hypothetical protein
MYLDVSYTVQLLRNRKYSDSELLGIASKIVASAKQRKITGVSIAFWPPVTSSSAVWGSESVAQVVWASGGDLYTHGQVGDYSRHRFRVVYNYAKNKPAAEANKYGF